MTYAPLVATKNGKIRGIHRISPYSGKEYYSFLGVPYAQPPIGDLRFKAPASVKNWDGIWNASKERNDCIQFSMYLFQVVGSEDCLYMNIHVPEIPSKITNPKAVVVMIHGGSLVWGSGSEHVHGSPEFIIHQDVIYITVNYRLHILGFLNLNIPECPGNMGAKDVIMSLKWIRSNISSFGGDPENITLIGSSVGSIIIHLLMLSPLAKGLFHKAIMMGMYTFHPFIVFEKDPLTVAINFARTCGFNGFAPYELLNFYRNLPTDILLEKLKDINEVMQEKYKKINPSSPFSLSIECIEEGAFLPKSPIDLEESMYTVPTIFGVCDIENIFSIHPTYSSFIKNDLRTVYRQNIYSWLHRIDDHTMKIMERKIRKHSKENIANETETILSSIMIQQDLIVMDFYDTVANVMHRISPSTPIYVYQFQYQGELNEMSRTFKALGLPFNVQETCHSDDFYYWLYRKIIPNSEDSKMVETVTKLFTNFAKNGDPNFDEHKVQWMNTTPDKQCYLQINSQLKLSTGRPNRGKMSFWVKLKKTYATKPNN